MRETASGVELTSDEATTTKQGWLNFLETLVSTPFVTLEVELTLDSKETWCLKVEWSKLNPENQGSVSMTYLSQSEVTGALSLLTAAAKEANQSFDYGWAPYSNYYGSPDSETKKVK